MFSPNKPGIVSKLAAASVGTALTLGVLPRLDAQQDKEPPIQKTSIDPTVEAGGESAGASPSEENPKELSDGKISRVRTQRAPFLTLPTVFQTDVMFGILDPSGKVKGEKLLIEAASFPSFVRENLILCTRIADLNLPTNASLQMGHLINGDNWDWRPVTIRSQEGTIIPAHTGTALERPDGYYLYFVKTITEDGRSKSKLGLAISHTRDENFLEQRGGVVIPFTSRAGINMHPFVYVDDKGMTHLFVSRSGSVTESSDRKRSSRSPRETVGYAVSDNGRKFTKREVPKAFLDNGFLGSVSSDTALISVDKGILLCRLADGGWEASDDLVLKNAFAPSLISLRGNNRQEFRVVFGVANKRREAPSISDALGAETSHLSNLDPDTADVFGDDNSDLRTANEIYGEIFSPVPLEDSHPLRRLDQLIGTAPETERTLWDPELQPELASLLEGLEGAIADFERAGTSQLDASQGLGDLHGINSLANAAILNALALGDDGEIQSDLIARRIESVLGNANHIPDAGDYRFEVLYATLQNLAYGTATNMAPYLETGDLERLSASLSSQDYGPMRSLNTEVPESSTLPGGHKDLDAWISANTSPEMSEEELENAVNDLIRHNTPERTRASRKMPLEHLERQRRRYEDLRAGALDAVNQELELRAIEATMPAEEVPPTTE